MTRQTQTLASALIALALVASSGCRSVARPDDDLEPNNDVGSATDLTLGVAVEARANQGDADVFCLETTEPAVITFAFESRGLEDCAAFEVLSPSGESLYAERSNLCARKRVAEPSERVELENPEPGEYRLEVEAATPGLYCVIVRELGAPDNLLPFSWDYRLTATQAGL